MSSMEVNVDMLEQMDLMDMSDHEALDVFLNSGAEDNSVASPMLGIHTHTLSVYLCGLNVMFRLLYQLDYLLRMRLWTLRRFFCAFLTLALCTSEKQTRLRSCPLYTCQGFVGKCKVFFHPHRL